MVDLWSYLIVCISPSQFLHLGSKAVDIQSGLYVFQDWTFFLIRFWFICYPNSNWTVYGLLRLHISLFFFFGDDTPRLFAPYDLVLMVLFMCSPIGIITGIGCCWLGFFHLIICKQPSYSFDGFGYSTSAYSTSAVKEFDWSLMIKFILGFLNLPYVVMELKWSGFWTNGSSLRMLSYIYFYVGAVNLILKGFQCWIWVMDRFEMCSLLICLLY